ncbi:MAG: hypothetical protein O6766_06585 [Gammaproteobacteria bacterium]|nr:hypothetical protein [Gammaproteobacteria bacterium]
MNKALRILTALPAVMFLATSVRWLVDPAGAAATIGMPLLDGLARSSQIGDLGAFFLAAGSMLLLGVITLQREWFYGAALLFGGAAVFRVLAWAAQDAALATPMIVVEVVVTLLAVATALTSKQPRPA